MQYDRWLKRQQQFRIKILESSPTIRITGIYSICQDCGEVCLCHEESCPNCNSNNIKQQVLKELDRNGLIQKRIRCRYRFNKLFVDENTSNISSYKRDG
jgi:hypothetical protein